MNEPMKQASLKFQLCGCIQKEIINGSAEYVRSYFCVCVGSEIVGLGEGCGDLCGTLVAALAGLVTWPCVCCCGTRWYPSSSSCTRTAASSPSALCATHTQVSCCGCRLVGNGQIHLLIQRFFVRKLASGETLIFTRENLHLD